MNNSLSELINHATQCLIDLGLSPETIKCYQCSAFHPLERKLENQKNISSSMLMEQEGYFGKQFQEGKISRQTYNWRIRGIRILAEVCDTGRFTWKVYSKKEKAIAIIQNKAEVAMCIPYMRAKQESYSNKVFNAMPGLLVTVDYNLKIIQMNEAASKLFNMPKKRRLIGKPVSEIMDDYSLASILAFERNLMQDEIYLEDQKCYLDRVMTNDKENKMILCIMKDITKERKHKDQIHNAQIEAARMADKLVEEQLKIVQQIAGLLGETAADTKVAVEKLKNTILLESEEENEKK